MIAAQIEAWFRKMQTEDVDAAIVRTCIPREHAEQLGIEAEEAGILVEHYAGFLLTTAVLRHRGTEPPPADVTAAKLRELASAVAEMRLAQQGFFSSAQGTPQKKSFYITSLKWEHRVDAMVRELMAPPKPPAATTPELFPCD